MERRSIGRVAGGGLRATHGAIGLGDMAEFVRSMTEGSHSVEEGIRLALEVIGCGRHMLDVDARLILAHALMKEHERLEALQSECGKLVRAMKATPMTSTNGPGLGAVGAAIAEIESQTPEWALLGRPL